MKRMFIVLMIFTISAISFAQDASKCGGMNSAAEKKAMKIGIVIYSNDAETVWNAFRLANYSQSEGDTVSIFLLGKGVEAQKISTKDFDITGQMDDFAASGGEIFACGTCLRLRNQEGTNQCPVSSLSDLYAIIQTSEKILTF
jgi:sulfur relay (sulfurtransferase) complex TusBCD TusD component (DsrE family)